MNILRITRADQVRTGETIITHFAHATRGKPITVGIVHRERFTNPDGETLDVIRYTGVTDQGQCVDRSYGSRPDDRVYVLQEAPFKADVPGSGVFGALAADDLPVGLPDMSPAGWLDDQELIADVETELL